MAPLSPVWTACVWTAATLYVLHALEIQYPELGKWETVNCKCRNRTCQAVFWFWMGNRTQGKPHFLLFYNNAERIEYGITTDLERFKGSKKDSLETTYLLRIGSVQKSDAGRYFCLIQYFGGEEPGLSQTELRPGESPPTVPPVTKTPKKPPPSTRWKSKKEPPPGCSPHILWSLVGVLLSLAAVLIGTLYYFSRLPKKCRHKFRKKQQPI